MLDAKIKKSSLFQNVGPCFQETSLPWFSFFRWLNIRLHYSSTRNYVKWKHKLFPSFRLNHLQWQENKPARFGRTLFGELKTRAFVYLSLFFLSFSTSVYIKMRQEEKTNTCEDLVLALALDTCSDSSTLDCPCGSTRAIDLNRSRYWTRNSSKKEISACWGVVYCIQKVNLQLFYSNAVSNSEAASSFGKVNPDLMSLFRLFNLELVPPLPTKERLVTLFAQD